MNNVNLIGRLTKDAQIVEMKDGNRSVINFILAVTKDFMNDKGEREADFIPVSYWTNHADKLCSYLKKGKLIGINGRICARSYVKEEIKKYVTSVEAHKIQFLEHNKEALA
ncbi:single-stranded DNA-binding protein [Clostridium sp. WILCCON 0269]|uniref:Single-stranded DNA-binding protein n=1 Tax=Candidatus Clostridium eludens TaxID=3381663 RepID=A0ABW8SHV9_9CLOT